MRKFILFIFIIGLTPSCKKGENDPSFTLLTRTNRLSGVWVLQNATFVNQDSTETISDNNLVTQYQNFTSEPLPVSIVYSFEAPGTYKINKEYIYPDNFNNSGSIAYTWNYEERGVWNFAGGEGDTPKKSRLLLIPDYFEENISVGGSNIEAKSIENPRDGYLFDIDELRNDKLVLKYNLVKNTEDGSIVQNGNLSFKKQ